MPEEAKSSEAKPAEAPPAPPPPHYEEDLVERDHTMVINGTEIPYRSQAGRVLLREEDGKKLASFFFTAYTRSDVDDPAARPIVFAFNGGPGSSSVWLHMGAFGPKRVDLDDEGMPGPLPGRLVLNEESLLDVADVVFIDPVGTGFSRGIPREDQKKYHHFKRDIESVGEFIRIYLTRHQRWASPKFLAGESYGTTRSAGLAAHLLDRHGIYFSGIILVSAILNFLTGPFDTRTWTFSVGHDLPYVVFLPTYAATAWYHGRVAAEHRKKPLREFLAEVEAWAFGEYATALLQGDQLDERASREVIERLSGYTGMPVDYLEDYRMRIEILRFCKELRRSEGLTVGRLDSRYTGSDRFLAGDMLESDPSNDAISGHFAATFNDYMRSELGYESDLPYEVLSLEVHQAWDYEDFKNAIVDTSESLRQVMSRNRHMGVLVANGFFDLATPHKASEYTFSHMGLTEEQRQRVHMTYYEAGHMMYVHRPSHRQFATDVRSFILGASA